MLKGWEIESRKKHQRFYLLSSRYFSSLWVFCTVLGDEKSNGTVRWGRRCGGGVIWSPELRISIRRMIYQHAGRLVGFPHEFRIRESSRTNDYVVEMRSHDRSNKRGPNAISINKTVWNCYSTERWKVLFSTCYVQYVANDDRKPNYFCVETVQFEDRTFSLFHPK